MSSRLSVSRIFTALAGAVLLVVLLSRVSGGSLIPAHRQESVDFSHLATADTLVVRLGGEEVRSISDATAVQQMAAVLQRSAGTWDVPWWSMSTGRVGIDFSSQGKIIDGVFLGEGFMTTNRGEASSTRTVRQRDIDEALALVGLTRQDLEWR